MRPPDVALAHDGQDLTLALGGGAAKGLAHIGVLKGIEEDGVEVTAIAGTSMGSIIGALAAQGVSAREMEALFRAIDWVRLGRIMVTSVSGAAFHDMLRESFGGILIEDLADRLRRGLLLISTPARWSFSTPEIWPKRSAPRRRFPGSCRHVIIGGRRLVDGAVVEPVPVTAASAMATGAVLAVNVVRPPGRQEQGAAIMTTMPIRVELPVGLSSRSRAGSDVSAPSVIEGEISARVSRWESVFRSFHIMQHRLATCSRIDVPMIEPRVGRFGWFDFHRADEIIAAGYEAYREWARDCPPRTPSSHTPRSPGGTWDGRF